MIKSAAIKKNGKVYVAISHADAIKEYLLAVGYSIAQIYTDPKVSLCVPQGDYKEGFITTGGFFVDRKEAAEIAFEHGQIKEKVSELSSGMIGVTKDRGIIDWNKKSCNTCNRSVVHSSAGRGLGWSLLTEPKDCKVSKRCNRAFNEHLSHKKFMGNNKKAL